MDTYLLIARNFLTNSWHVMCSVKYPGLNVSVAGMVIAFFLACLGLKIFFYVLGFQLGTFAPTKHIYRPKGPVGGGVPGRITDGSEHSLTVR